MTSSSSLARRAVLAVALMIGFYVLSLIVAAGLLYVPYAMWLYAHRVNFQIAFFCVVTAGVILLALLPRIDRFVAPGPKLEAAQHPRLFHELSRVAQTVQQDMPAEVYLVADVNAWVSQRGGVMGFGSRRVMGLGLPLLQVLTTAQLRAVLAHEFGHYYGGDTKLGPWIYKTRMAIVRAVQSVGAQSSLVQKPFLWYGNMFMNITQAVSRQQEFTADALAARTVGAKPLADGLRVVHGASNAFDVFWQSEFTPVLQAGYRPPFASGFQRFVSAPHISEAITKSVEEEIKEAQTDPYDTHPPLRERLTALATMPDYAAPQQASDELPALSLFENVAQLEADLVTSLLAGQDVPQILQPVAWEDAGTEVFLPLWENMCQENARALQGLLPSDYPKWANNLGEIGQRMVVAGKAWLTTDERVEIAQGVLSAALALALQQNGATLQALPGEPVRLQKDATIIEPFTVISRLQSGDLSTDEWQQQCAATGIATIDLSTIAGCQKE